MNALPPDSKMGRWWTYAINFRQIHNDAIRNLHQSFPMIGQRLHDGAYTGERRSLMEYAVRTNGGVIVVTGCPGAGKTTVAIAFCGCVLSAPVVTTSIQTTVQAPATDGSTTEIVNQSEQTQPVLGDETKVDLEAQDAILIAAILNDENDDPWVGIDQMDRAAAVERHKLRRINERNERRQRAIEMRMEQDANDEDNGSPTNDDEDGEEHGSVEFRPADDQGAADNAEDVDQSGNAWGVNTSTDPPAVFIHIHWRWPTSSDKARHARL